MRLRRLLGNATGLPGTTLHVVTRAVSGVVEPREVHRTPGRTRIQVIGVDEPGSRRTILREVALTRPDEGPGLEVAPDWLLGVLAPAPQDSARSPRRSPPAVSGQPAGGR